MSSRIKRYDIKYPLSAYTFPRDSRVSKVSFEKRRINIELMDERKLSIPLKWIPSLSNAPREELEKYEINRSSTMVIWDPDKCGINEELCLADYLETDCRKR